MTQTMAERKKRQRERLRASGAIPMSFVLEPGSLESLLQLRKAYGSVDKAINAAINHRAKSQAL